MRKKYKSLYLKAKCDKETYKRCLDSLLETLKTFDNVEVKDKIWDRFPLDTLREIEVRQNDKFLDIALNVDLLSDKDEEE